jgi:hypothetical protein
MPENKAKSVSVSNDAVAKSTGKEWDEWFSIIDKAGGKSKSHKEIVAFLREHFSLSPWYQQMITVSFEQARGKRKVHQTRDGFQISKTKTFPWGISELRECWLNEQMRRKWLQNSAIEVTGTLEKRSIRFIRPGDACRYEVSFLPLEVNKTRLTVQQNRIADAGQAEDMKEYWHNQLRNLLNYLENKYPSV